KGGSVREEGKVGDRKVSCVGKPMAAEVDVLPFPQFLHAVHQQLTDNVFVCSTIAPLNQWEYRKLHDRLRECQQLCPLSV
ncbi:MAG: hypothetical protein ACKESB_02105, partial [Candidatus Hodgkinia cicadicola]